jgi:Protein of unknown function (DUF2806)
VLSGGNVALIDTPGEKLATRMLESIEKVIPSILRPWLTKRERRAETEAEAERLIVLAHAERLAEQIRGGEMTVAVHNGKYVALAAPSQESAVVDQQLPGLAPELPRTLQLEHAEALRKEVNVAKAIHEAEVNLSKEEADVPDTKPEDDWLYRWRDYAASVSAESLQLLWGRVLAGEIKAPGSFPLRFLNFLHNLDQREAELISRVMPFVIGGAWLPRDWGKVELEAAGIGFDSLLELQQLGVLSGADSLGLSITFGSDKSPLVILLRAHQFAIQAKSPTRSNIPMSCCLLTPIGKQICKLGNFLANENYVIGVAKSIKALGDLTVGVGIVIRETADGFVNLTNYREL